MTRAVNLLQRESRVYQVGGNLWSLVLLKSWKWRHRVSHTVPLGKHEVLQVEAGRTNTF